MRKITRNAVNAFVAGQTFSEGNTTVGVNTLENRICMYLHGNLIASRPYAGGSVEITHAGWPTPTTKERLNGILKAYDEGYIFQKKGVWFINGNAWDGNRYHFTTDGAKYLG